MKSSFLKPFALAGLMALAMTACKLGSTPDNSAGDTASAVASTSSQLASSSSFSLSGTSTSTGSGMSGPGGMGPGGHHGPGGPHDHGMLDGTSFLAIDDNLLAIIDAETAGDFRGMRMHEMGGATVTNYDASGNVVTMAPPPMNGGGPEGCSFSGKQFPKFDSLLAKIAKTVIDYGSGVTMSHGTTSITRSGKMIITRSGSGTTHTEVITFDSYKVNGSLIQGTKTRISTFDATTGNGISSTSVTDGKITFSDGTSATWTSARKRTSSITLDADNRPSSGTISTDGSTVVTGADGTTIYSHNITKTLIENIACGPERHGPVSGVVEAAYKSDKVSVDFGDGSCSNRTVTVTLNGVATTQTIGF